MSIIGASHCKREEVEKREINLEMLRELCNIQLGRKTLILLMADC